MAKPTKAISIKHMQISKANTVISAALAIASFLTVFSLVASKSMIDQRSFNSRVIAEKETALSTLESNVEAIKTLEASYRQFVSQDVNLIGGERTGKGDRDGDNAKLILDALPSKYDFPAVATSIEKILESKSLAINQIEGTDDEIAQAALDHQVPEVVAIPFAFSVTGNYDGVHDLIRTLEFSIRPFNIMTLKFSASGDNEVVLDIEANTFYQSEKRLNVTEKVLQ